MVKISTITDSEEKNSYLGSHINCKYTWTDTRIGGKL